MKWFENYDIHNIETPVKVDELKQLLEEARYDKQKTKYLINGFSEGFSLNFTGDREVVRMAPNLPFTIGNETILWNKVMNEVEVGRYAGPYTKPPFKHFIQSPIGLVPKDKGKKTRLIFHLSYPKDGSYDSVNKAIPYEACKVKYPSFDKAVKLCIQAGKFAYIAKSDMSCAFRNIPLMVREYMLLVMKAKHPVNGKWYFFVDKCLPFGSSISCAIFQAFSDAIAFLVTHRINKPVVNYLDDYFFAALRKMICDWQVNQFLDICKRINFPVSLEKTFWGTTILTFLGLLLNTETQTVSIPYDKVQKALNLMDFYLDRKNKKTTVQKAQELCGLLNFLCKCVVPGRAFVTRLYSMTGTGSKDKKLKPHHHVRITEEHRLDIQVWNIFLNQPDVYCRPFLDYTTVSAEEIDMYSDASANPKLGFGALCQSEYLYGKWDENFIRTHKPSIQFLELYAFTAGVLKWIWKFKNKRVCLFIDNESAMHMINNSSSKCKNCMMLIRLITIESLIHNVRISAKYVASEDNGLADSLSRMDFDRFRRLGPHMANNCEQIPEELLPMSNLWIK